MSLSDSELELAERLETYGAAPHLLGSDSLLEQAKLKTDFLIDDAIPARAITLIVGKPGGGKSWLAYELVRVVAQGEPSWLGHESSLADPAQCLVLSYDNPAPELARRFLRLGLQPNDPVSFHAPVRTEPLRIGGSSDEAGDHSELLCGMVNKLRPSLIVVDSFRQAHVLNENDSGEMGRAMSVLKRWVAMGSAVVVVHHATLDNDGQLKARGSGEITASADAIITIDSGKYWWGKTRSWEPVSVPAVTTTAIPFQLVDDGDRTEVAGADGSPALRKRRSAALEKVRAHLASGGALKPQRDLVRAVGCRREDVAWAVKQLGDC